MTLLLHCKCGGSSQRVNFAIIALIAWTALLGTVSLQPLIARAQVITIPGPTPPGTSIIPALSVSERYDSNVWYAPAQFLPPGTQLWDFVTTLQGSVRALHKDKDVVASLVGGVDGNVYAHNKGLNYISTRVDAYANLNGWAEHFAKGAQLRIYDYFRYTPTSPGFLNGGATNTQDPFLRGIQSFRANTFSNTLNTDGFLPVFRDIGIQGGYAFSVYRVGSPINTTQSGAIQFFDTNVHTWSVGPRLQMTKLDSVALVYQQSLINQSQAQTQTGAPAGGTAINTNTQSVTANYYRTTPSWTFAVGGGVTLIEPASKAFPTGNITISNNPERSTTVQLTLSRQAAPSFYITSGAMISNLAQVQVIHRYTKALTLRGSVNYGYSETIPLETGTTFRSFSILTGLNYRLTKQMSVDLNYEHNDFQTQAPGFGYTMLRNAVAIFLTAEWK